MAWVSSDTTDTEKHIEELAARYDIDILWSEHPHAPCAYSWYKMVKIRPTTTPARYIEGLHELGHCLNHNAKRFEKLWGKGKHGGRSYDTELLCEAGAWAWAWHHVDPEFAEAFGKKMAQHTAACLASYLVQVPVHKDT